MSTIEEEKSPSEDRIVLLSDGVFAVAMTLLVIDIRLPEGLPLQTTTFQVALQPLFPKIISYVISFFIISNYWVVHRRIINYLKHIDASFIRLNLLLLFFVTALPITTTFNFQPYLDTPNLSTIIYTLSLALNGFTITALWINATWKHRLVDPNLEQIAINFFLIRSLIPPITFLLSLLILLIPSVDHDYVYYSWLLISVFFFVLSRFQKRLFLKQNTPSKILNQRLQIHALTMRPEIGRDRCSS